MAAPAGGAQCCHRMFGCVLIRTKLSTPAKISAPKPRQIEVQAPKLQNLGLSSQQALGLRPTPKAHRLLGINSRGNLFVDPALGLALMVRGICLENHRIWTGLVIVLADHWHSDRLSCRDIIGVSMKARDRLAARKHGDSENS